MLRASLLLALLLLTTPTLAGDGPHGRGWGSRPHWHHRPVDPAPGFWGGVFGGIIGGMLAKPDPAPPPPPPPPPVPEALEPWTPEWYDYCGNKYRTFDPKTGYYNGFDGERHFCQGVG